MLSVCVYTIIHTSLYLQDFYIVVKEFFFFFPLQQPWQNDSFLNSLFVWENFSSASYKSESSSMCV